MRAAVSDLTLFFLDTFAFRSLCCVSMSNCGWAIYSCKEAQAPFLSPPSNSSSESPSWFAVGGSINPDLDRSGSDAATRYMERHRLLKFKLKFHRAPLERNTDPTTAARQTRGG